MKKENFVPGFSPPETAFKPNFCNFQLSRENYKRIYDNLKSSPKGAGRLSFAVLVHSYRRDISSLLCYVRELEGLLGYQSTFNN
jgi:hypothetical protein